MDIDNVAHEFWKKVAELHKIDSRSVLLWLEKLKTLPVVSPTLPMLPSGPVMPAMPANKNEKFFTFYHEALVRTKTGKFKKKIAIGFAHPWQLEKLRSNAASVGLDSTHKVTRFDYELFTVIIQDPESMSGVPVAFLLTNNKTAEPLAGFLAALQKLIPPIQYITTDDSSMEQLAIKDAFDGRVRIHLCLWHVARAWWIKLRALVSGNSTKESRHLRLKALNGLKAIMYEPDLLQARLQIVKFREDWATNQPLIDYLNK
ncbi:hypothetical protein BG006_004095, partial [Podila minutissima]